MSYEFTFLTVVGQLNINGNSLPEPNAQYQSRFILEYNEKAVNISATPLKRQDVDWSQSRVIFVAPEFIKYQQYAFLALLDYLYHHLIRYMGQTLTSL